MNFKEQMLWISGGGALLSLFTFLQKIFSGDPVELFTFVVPFVFGGATGLFFFFAKECLRRFYATLEQSEERYRALYEQTPAMLHSIDSDGRIVSANNLWLTTLGYAADEVLGKKLTDFMAPASRRLAENLIFPQFFENGSVEDVPYQMVKKGGDVVDVVVSATSERGADGAFVRSLAVVTDVTDRNRAEAQVLQMAYHDLLTGLPNRFLFQERLNQVLAEAGRGDLPVEVLFIGLDCFRGINDSLGYQFGDHLLKAAGERLSESLLEGETLARLVGDEFVAFIPHPTTDEDGSLLAERVIESLAAPFSVDGREIYCTAAIGIASFPKDGRTVDALLGNADIAMNAAKRQGRNLYRVFSSDMNELVTERFDIETRLRKALKEDELSLVYQPQFDLKTGRMIGVEALMRWRLADGSWISPAKFIPVAEESGLILPMGEWVIRRACTQLATWTKMGCGPLKMAINISGPQFTQPSFLATLEEVVERAGVEPSMIELELTESILMENVGDVIMTLTDLKVRGFQLAVDDFGTGYSSLSYLKNFPLDRLKIAQEFMREIPENSDDVSIVEAILAMARSLDLTVIAEGVETEEQLEFLKKRGCDEVQGYLYARPLPPDELLEHFEDQMRGEAISSC